MPTLIEGSHSPGAGRYALVAARFNQLIVDQLVAGAVGALQGHGVREEDIEVFRVPGCFEVPLVAQQLAKSGHYAAVICLGAVIRGDTDHYEYIARAAAEGVARAALETGVPCIFGVLTCDTVEQAMARAGLAPSPVPAAGKNATQGNKGVDAALTAIEMANLLRKLPGGASA